MPKVLPCKYSSIIGLIGYLWAGGLDDPEQLGVRDMPESVKAKNAEIGKMIKAIYSPCEVTGIQDIEKPKLLFSVFPNPANEWLTIDFPDNETNKTLIQIFNSTGMLLIETLISQSTQINITDLPDGIYFVQFKGNPQLTIKFIKQEKR